MFVQMNISWLKWVTLPLFSSKSGWWVVMESKKRHFIAFISKTIQSSIESYSSGSMFVRFNRGSLKRWKKSWFLCNSFLQIRKLFAVYFTTSFQVSSDSMMHFWSYKELFNRGGGRNLEVELSLTNPASQSSIPSISKNFKLELHKRLKLPKWMTE